MKLRLLVLGTLLAFPLALIADVNVLLLGSGTPGDQGFGTYLGNVPTPAFEYEQVANHLRLILEEADQGNVNVTTRDRFSGSISQGRYCNNLVSWFYWPYGEWEGEDPTEGWYYNTTGTETTRWSDLRGGEGTAWDYVIIIGDPYTIETTPGYYTLGVAKIAEEVAQGNGQAVLLMPWPESGPASLLTHYKEVVYRTGRTAGIPVVPAGLAWDDAGLSSGVTHPTSDGAFIAAASIYSRLFGESVSATDYEYNDTLADNVHTVVTNNQGAVQYSGPFTFNNPFKMLGDKHRYLYHSNRGTSTENRIRRWLNDHILPDLKLDRSWTRETYNSNTPDDDLIDMTNDGVYNPTLNWPSNWPNTAFNWGRHQASAGDGSTKSYFTNREFWQLGFGFAYHATTDPDTFVSQTLYRELSLAFLMKEGTTSQYSYNLSAYDQAEEIATARLIPLHTLYSIIRREIPGMSHKQDSSHYNRGLGRSAATFMYTLYSGRTPMEENPQEVVIDGNVISQQLNAAAQRIGYETAWILGNVQARAPGLKVTPASTDTSPATETMSVRFFFPPQEDVTVNITVSAPAMAEVFPESITFTPQNYDIPVDVVVRAKQTNPGSDPTYDVVFTTTSADEVYEGVMDSWTFTLPSSNLSPSLTITSPMANSTHPVGTDLTVTADSSDPDGTVQHVTLWLNGTLVRQDNSAPYSWSVGQGDSLLENLADDLYQLQLTAVDNDGASFTKTIQIEVGSPETTPPPPPAGLFAVPSFGTVSLNWDDSGLGDFDSYRIYRGTTAGNLTLLDSGLTNSDYTDADVVNGTTYFYAVVARDIFGNLSSQSAEVEATPEQEDGTILFGSDQDGLGGFTQSPVDPTQESWSTEATSVRYINDDPDGINNGAEGGTKDASLLREFIINRTIGTSYEVQGVVFLADGYGDDNNRLGLYLFGDVASGIGSSESGALSLQINTDNNSVAIVEGLNGSTIVSTPKTGTLLSDSLFGTALLLTAEIEFIDDAGTPSIDITFTLRDADDAETTVSTRVAAAAYTGDYFGFATRARTRGIASSNRDDTWTMDYKSFRLTPRDSDEDGMSDYLETIAGSDPNDGNSTFQLVKATPITNGAVAFQVTVNLNSYYRVSYRDSLVSGSWQPLSGYENVTPADTSLLIEDTSPPAARYYRIEAQTTPF